MCRIVLLLALSLLLSSCVSTYYYFSRANEYFFSGKIDGKDKSDVEKFDLVYIFNGDTAKLHSFFLYDSNLERQENGHIKSYYNFYCNVLFTSSLHGCTNKLSGVVGVEIYLRNNKVGRSYLLAKKNIDMDAYRRAELRTQVFLGSDFERYEIRPRGNIDWSKMEQLVLKDENDTIYHYTVNYWEKREKSEDYLNHFIDENYFVEVP